MSDLMKNFMEVVQNTLTEWEAKIRKDERISTVTVYRLEEKAYEVKMREEAAAQLKEFIGAHLNEEVEDVRSELQAKIDGLAELQKKTEAERDELARKLSAVGSPAANVWFWQGEGDQPANLICPVVMDAETLRVMLARIPTPDTRPECTGSLVHDEYTFCPRHP